MRGPWSRGPLTGITVALLLGACDDDAGTGPTEPSGRELRIAIVSGDGQQGLVGTSLSEFLVVRVSVGSGEPAEDVAVQWSVLEGGGMLSLKGPRTDREGLAAAVLFLGDDPGEQVIRAGLESGAEVVFTARAMSPEPPLILRPPRG